MIVSFVNRVLGHIINTRKLTVETPQEYVAEVLHTLNTTWGNHQKQFDVQMASELAGKLNQIAITAPWLKHLMPQIYLSLAAALHMNQREEIRSSKSFRLALQAIRNAPATPDGQKLTAKLIHQKKDRYNINRMLRKELAIIRTALVDKSIKNPHLLPTSYQGRHFPCLAATLAYTQRGVIAPP
jgi:hypothetical protein